MFFKINQKNLDRLKEFSNHNLIKNKNSKSDYWLQQANNIKISFNTNSISIFGKSGVYIPKKKNIYNFIKNFVINLKNLILNYKNSFNNYKHSYNYFYDNQIQHYQKININFKNTKIKNFNYIKKNFFKDKIINEKIIHAYYFFNIINEKINLSDNKIICEIGPGNGNLISILKKNNPNLKFILIDLKETLLVSSSYLINLFPNSKFLISTEINRNFNKDDYKNYDFLFILPEHIDLLPSNLVDLSINISSFGEMKKKQIEIYFHLIQRISKNGSNFFNYNRVEKFPIDSMQKESSVTPNRFHEYPFNKNNYTEIFQICDFAKNIQKDPIFLKIEKIVK